MDDIAIKKTTISTERNFRCIESAAVSLPDPTLFTIIL